MAWGEWRTLVTTYLRPHRKLVAQLGTVLCVTIGLQVATPQIVRLFIDRATAPKETPLFGLTALYLGAVMLQQGFRVVTAWLSEVVGWLTTNELRADLMTHCLGLDPAFHQATPPGALIERIDGDLNGLSLFFAEFLLNVVGNALLLFAVLTVVWVQNTFAGLVLTAFAIAGAGLMLTVRRVSAAAWGKSRGASAELFGFLEERLAGTEDIRSSGAEAFTMRGFYGRARDRLWTTSHARIVDAIPQSVTSVIGCSCLAVSFALPAYLVGQGKLSVGAAFAVYFYAQVLLQPLSNVSRQVEQLQVAIAGGRRVLELLALKSDVVDGDGAELGQGPFTVAFDHVTFGYGDDPDVLHDVSLSVAPGEVLGVVGRTGSGKSSLAKLLVRLYDPRGGAVVLGGVDIRALHRSQLRSHVALVTQEVRVMRASVRDNLTLFDPTIGDDAIEAAIHQLGLGSWFAALPTGSTRLCARAVRGCTRGSRSCWRSGGRFSPTPQWSCSTRRRRASTRRRRSSSNTPSTSCSPAAPPSSSRTG
jgi:ABC-type multidrug transport system fused ATPase/permease subunit